MANATFLERISHNKSLRGHDCADLSASVSFENLRKARPRIALRSEDSPTTEIRLGVVGIVHQHPVCLGKIPERHASKQMMGQVIVVAVHTDEQPLQEVWKTVARQLHFILVHPEHAEML